MKKYMYLFFVALFATMSVTFTSCGDDDDENTSLLGTFVYSYDDDGDYVTETMTFNDNGTCVNSYRSSDYPEDNFTVTANYTVEGNPGESAILLLWGETVDGDTYRESFQISLSDNRLTMTDKQGNTSVWLRQ